MQTYSNHYKTLGLEDGVQDVARIKQAYRTKAKHSHPASTHRSTRSAKEFMAVKEAFDILIDAHKRAAHDEELEKTRKESSSASGSSKTETGKASDSGESDSASGSGNTDTSTGSGQADSDSGTKGNAGASGIHTEPHPKSERKEGPKHHDNHHHRHYGPRWTFEMRDYPFSQSVYPGKYFRLRAMHVANAPRPTFRPAYRQHLHAYALG